MRMSSFSQYARESGKVQEKFIIDKVKKLSIFLPAYSMFE
jgi:hypothetical protein